MFIFIVVSREFFFGLVCVVVGGGVELCCVVFCFIFDWVEVVGCCVFVFVVCWVGFGGCSKVGY